MSSVFDRLEALFHAAAPLAAWERRDFLDQLDGDDRTLRGELEELLAMRSVACDFFEAETAPAREPSGAVGTIEPGDVIGDFEIEGVIASGAMGTVFEARQRRPGRRAALKVVRADMATASILKRFDLEAEILGSLEHAGIARIYAAGIHRADSGDVPWFAMEYVDGVALTEFANANGLGRRERLEVFLGVCDAAEHAHRRGIIHRDLKPQNILVGRDGIARVLDFGVARVTGEGLQLATIEADVGRIVGTLAYMSPEQTLADPHAIDTRADIYALGAVLFELLAGRRPFELGGKPLIEAVRIIREDEAPRLGDIDPRLRGDLEVIVAHALEKDRDRRYGGAAELAADIRRHLANEPIAARPAGSLYRARKFVRRNPAFSFAVFALVLALAAGAAGTLAGLDEARVESRLKDEALLEFERMADVKRLESALQEASALWPEHSDLVPRLEDWLRRYRPMFERLDLHRATLQRIRARAGPYGERERRRDFAAEYAALDSLVEEAARLEDALDDAGSDAAEDRIANVFELTERRADMLRADLGSRRRWDFGEDVESQFMHDTLTSLVDGIRVALDPDPHVGVVADISQRLERSRRIRDETIVSRAQDWAAARKRVRDDPRFELDLAPITGLIPLGPDPDSKLEEFLHWASHDGAVVDREDGDLVLDESAGIVLVLVPGGRFLMGAQDADPDLPNFDAGVRPAEQPVQQIELAPFLISKYELTQSQWVRVRGTNPSFYIAGLAYRPGRVTHRHPVENVDHEACIETLRRLGLFLPTDAQWERACRAGTTTAFYSGADVASLRGHANIADEGSDRFYAAARADGSEDGFDDGFAMHAPVGSFHANPFGLHDMHGNVFEWCRDVRTLSIDPVLYPARPGDGLRSPGDTQTRMRLVRGGSFMASGVSARAAGRGLYERTHRDHGLGCRPCRPVTP